MLVCYEGDFIANPPRIEAVSTIGAEDSSIAGFIAAASAGKSACDLIRTAIEIMF